MGKSKLIKRSKFLIAGAVAGCVAGSVQAATPPAAPSVPTAPPPPAYQYESSAGYPTGTNAFYSPGNSAYSPYHQGAFTLKPAQESPSPAGGYLLIRNTPRVRTRCHPVCPNPTTGSLWCVVLRALFLPKFRRFRPLLTDWSLYLEPEC